LTREDGSYAFLGARPTPYPIRDDGPVGRMLAATGRHPWRPAHLHMIVSAPGYQKLTTHIFDADSEDLDSDAVFAVKPSLLRCFSRAQPTTPTDRPASAASGSRSRTTSSSRRQPIGDHGSPYCSIA
jgi:catechol 1,2-dioxygenase